jgi:hypothetical protein
MGRILIRSAVIGLLFFATGSSFAGDFSVAAAPMPAASSSQLQSLQLCAPLGFGSLRVPSILTCFQMSAAPAYHASNLVAFSSTMSRMSSAVLVNARPDISTAPWNLTAFMSQHWTDQLRSEIGLRHMQLASHDTLQMGEGQLVAASAGLSYSLLRGLDIGLEFQYANLKSKFGSVGLAAPHSTPSGEERNISTRLRVDRAF